ncbi:hypothetical protein HDE68_004556 [Pedobacter cryoconitis]|uniref:Signal transduction histidine kinase internal region domain-containing protein n=1 Tax=Pedobacter cryoconitis TaxID=188932 RepID=A0A7W8ZR16_9SPHI|nr:histidine kinase [Pedobacter cryoconitis]MBB5638624.1 hypothetical protein [Pedobacter cryoconitis]
MQRLLIVFTVLLFLSSCKSPVVYEKQPTVYQTGDNKRWAEKNFNTTSWLTERGNTAQGIFWSRSPVKLIKNPVSQLGLHLESFGAFEVYWDGIFIGRNGQITQKDKPEIAGYSTGYFQIPDSLAHPGLHILALRTSQSYFNGVKRPIGIELNQFADLLKNPLIITSFMNLMAGAFLIASVYYFFLYLNSRRKEHSILIFAIICSLFFSLLITEYIKFYIAIPYTRFFVRLEIIGWLTFAIAMLVPLYFCIQFHFSKKKILLITLFIILITIYIVNYDHFDLTALWYSRVMWFAAVVIVLNAIIQKEKGGLIVLTGLLASAIVNDFLFYDFGLFISFTLIILCMLYLHALRARVIEDEFQSSLLLSSRLQLELIKKNIQPHFIRNTLTSLIDWVEESPKQGAEFIQALAGEFDIMNSISEAVLIPIRQEIELCKTHLTVMQFRKEIRYEWQESGIDETEYIPPALIHTILENGITHSIPIAEGLITFKLTYLCTATYKQYTFETNALNRQASEKREGGNGFRYIQARLTESYSDRWKFISEAIPGGWLTTIQIDNK